MQFGWLVHSYYDVLERLPCGSLYPLAWWEHAGCRTFNSHHRHGVPPQVWPVPPPPPHSSEARSCRILKATKAQMFNRFSFELMSRISSSSETSSLNRLNFFG